jgi:methyl-accepting chemotaxis protein
MMSELREELLEINQDITLVSDSCKNIKNNKEVLVSVFNKQIEYTDSSTRSIQEIISKIESNTNKMSETSKIAIEALELSDRTDVIKKSKYAVKNIQEILKVSSDKFQELEASGQKIRKIIQSIANIAKKTSLLSLNASIEAAKAGELGQGFSVVADEISILSEQSALATKESNAILKTVLNDIHSVVTSFSEISEGIQSIDELIFGTVDMILETHTVFEKINSTIEEFMDTKKEEMSAAKEINENIKSIVEISNSFSTSIQEINLSTNELDKLVEALYKEISHFKLN